MDIDYYNPWFILIQLSALEIFFFVILQVDWPQPDASGKVNRDW